MKIALITNIIAPYRIPLFNLLAKENFSFKVFAFIRKNKNKNLEFNQDKIKFDYRIARFWKVLLYWPDIMIISGYDAVDYWLAFLYGKIFGKKYILWSGTTLLSSHKNGGLVRFFKKIIIKNASAYISYGSKASEYLEYFGAPAHKIFTGFNTVDISWFRKEITRYKKSPNKFKLLYVGQLIPRKGIIYVLQALKKLADPEINFTIVGTGLQEQELKDYCRKNKIYNAYFKGFCPREELPKYYARADALILPSLEEVWGLVVNEALAGGLPVLCSEYVGAAYDLIDPYKNGLIFKYQDLPKAILKAKQKKLISLGLEKFSINYYANNFIKAINYAYSN